MDTAQFLARVTPPGNYIVIGVNRTPSKPPSPGSFFHRFFPEGQFAEAAGFVRWASNEGFDAYHANASFSMAETNGLDARQQPKYRGSRKEPNVHLLKSFWADLDVKRAGDGKAAGAVYATVVDAVAWLGKFLHATKMPRPNLLVNSGYGLHAYWLLDDPMTRQDWQPYADAFKAALAANGFIGDIGITGDSTRVLRPPGTLNNKVLPGAPVSVIAKMTGPTLANAIVFAALQPYVGAARPKPAGTTVAASGATPGAAPSATTAALAGGNVSPIFGNTALAAAAPNMAQAASANLPTFARDKEFSRIATKCVQVQQSLASHGNGDDRPLWYLGFISLAEHCIDGKAYIHPISDGDPRYNSANVEAHAALAHKEWVDHNIPPPSCAHFEKVRPGVCQTCPFFGKVNSPADLGRDSGDLPDHYRRYRGAIQFEDKDKDGNVYWRDLIVGDFTEPALDWVMTGAGGYAFTVKHVRAGHDTIVYVQLAAIKPDAGAIFTLFAGQGVKVPAGMEQHFRRFILAWIDKLIDSKATRFETIRPFGWALDAGNVSGFAMAGRLYRGDGRVEAAPGADGVLLNWYSPQGDLAKWRAAFDFVARDRPDLQAVMACAVGSPLMHFTGQAGVCVSIFGGSGRGKSAALTVSTGFWGSPSAKNHMHDTSNSVFGKLAQTRHLPCNWDEARVSGDEIKRFGDMIFTLTGGKERSRMNSDITLRNVGDWKTILCIASNHPMQDYMVEQEASEAGALRVFEFEVQGVSRQNDNAAAQLIAQAESHYGRAGAIYAQWLAKNHATAAKAVGRISGELSTRLKADQSERFYVAAMSTMLAGAAIANHLQLTSFDLASLKDFLCATFRDLRAARQVNVSMVGGNYDLEQILGLYVHEHVGKKLVTDSYAAHGPKPKPLTILWQPAAGQEAAIHIATKDQLMRVSRANFNVWCRSKNLSATELLRQMGKKWGVVQARALIGAGTGYAGTQMWCLQFGLNHPDLQGFLISPPLTQAAPAAPIQGQDQGQPVHVPVGTLPVGALPTVAQRMAGAVPPA